MRPVLDAWVEMIAAVRAAGVPVIYTTPVSRANGADVVMVPTDLSAETGVPPLTVALGGTSPIVDVVSNGVISRLTQGVAVVPVRIIDAKGETRFAHLTHVDHGMSSMSHFFAGATSSRFHQPPPSAWNKAAVSA